MDNIEYEKNNKDRIPFEHYQAIFAQGDPEEMALRCDVPYDSTKKEFSFKVMDRNYTATFPDFVLKYEDGSECDAFNIKILLVRHLLEGKKAVAGDKKLTYRELPWGETYYRQFEGRCIKRMAYSFGYKLDKFSKAMEKLGAQKMDMGDVSYKLEFTPGCFIYFILWAADEEFDPTCQILFSDNFPFAYSTEDVAYVGDISIGRIKEIASTL